MTITLGTNKEVTLTSWKAKTKKEFIKIFKDKGDKVDEQDVLDILVKPYIDLPDKYYSSDELQYILVELRKMSINENIEFTMDCDNEECQKSIDVNITLSEIMNYQPSSYPLTENNIEWKDIEDPKLVSMIEQKYPEEPPREIAMLLHIDSYNGKKINRYEDILSIVDDLSIKEKNELDKSYDKVKASVTLKADIKCPHCGTVTVYNFDIIPTFFDPLLPKQM